MGLMSVDNGAGSKKQPVANIFLNSLYVSPDANPTNRGMASSYSDCFSVNNAALICTKAGAYHIVADASFRYGYFYVKVNNETKITVNGYTVPSGTIKTAEGDITLAAGDIVSVSTNYVNADVRYAVGNAHIFKA